MAKKKNARTTGGEVETLYYSDRKRDHNLLYNQSMTPQLTPV